VSETKHTTMKDHARDCEQRYHSCTCGYEAHLETSAAQLLALAYQYRDDLRHPPAPDSRERRLEAIESAIRKAEGSLT